MRIVNLLVLGSLALMFTTRGLASKIIDVVNHGAQGDGRTDDHEAFLAAWNEACTDPSYPTILVPYGKTFLLGRLMLFVGDCKSRVHFQVEGTIVAPNKVWTSRFSSHWITFKNVSAGLDLDGQGKIDGRGQDWWSCRSHNQCPDAPNALAFQGCVGVNLRGLTIINSPKMHVIIDQSVKVHLSGLTISAPEDSPNTDGVHIEVSKHVTVSNSSIGTGDDCISVGSGMIDLKVNYINCGPGHGISIGSLGRNGSKSVVEQVRVSNCNFSKTTNGLRIKTWQGGSGRARNITFESNSFYDVMNPIIIDQFYCENSNDCPEKASAVQISDVQYIGATGTSASKVAISLNCSQAVACTGITMSNITIQSMSGVPVTSLCSNVEGSKEGPLIPSVPCLS